MRSLLLLAALIPLVLSQVRIKAGKNIQDVVNANLPGQTYILEAGLYRLQNVQPQDGDTFIGEEGALMNGAMLLTDFQKSGNFWTVGNMTQNGQQQGQCVSSIYACECPEDLFFDNIPLARMSDFFYVIDTTKWYFDLTKQAIFFLADPTGHVVEIGTARAAFNGQAENVTIKNIIVEKYAIPAQMGAVGDQHPGNGWVIQNVEARLNHGTGIFITQNGKVLNCWAHDNGQKGVGANGFNDYITDCVFDGNEINNNNYAFFNPGWEAGGSKFSFTKSATITNNYAHDNTGAGLWSDINNFLINYSNNILINNSLPGIFHEISYNATMYNNTVAFNGYGFDPWLWGCQIQISTSSNADISYNLIAFNETGNGLCIVEQQRGTGSEGVWQSHGNNAHNNDITFFSARGLTGGVVDFSDPNFYPANRMDYNTYHVPTIRYFQAFDWDNSYQIWTDFQKSGAEIHGHIDSNLDNTMPAIEARISEWQSTYGTKRGVIPNSEIFGKVNSVNIN